MSIKTPPPAPSPPPPPIPPLVVVKPLPPIALPPVRLIFCKLSDALAVANSLTPLPVIVVVPLEGANVVPNFKTGKSPLSAVSVCEDTVKVMLLLLAVVPDPFAFI